MPITFLSYLRSFFSKRDSTLQRSLLLVIFSHFTLFVFIACFTYQTSFKDLKNKAHKTAEEIEKIIFDEFDSVLIECFVFLKEIQKNALNKRKNRLIKKT